MNIKILHINRNYITSPLHQVMMNHLDRLNIDNSVFAPTDGSEKALIVPNGNVFVSKCFSKWDRYIFDLKQTKIFSAIEHRYDISNFDCIHAYTLFTDGNCAMKLSEKYVKPYIVAVRNTDVNDFFKKIPFLRARGVKIMERASAICFLSKSYREAVLSQFVPRKKRELIRSKSYVIPNGIDDFWLENVNHKSYGLHEPLRLIYAGRIDRNKNIESIVDAIKELEIRGVEANLTVVGKVYDENIFRRIINCGYVQYHKPVSKESLIGFYRKCDIFVMPSFTESFGLVYAEAMSQGLPVIYTKGEGFDNQFPEGTVGYHVDPNDYKNIASKIIECIKNYDEMAATASKNAMKFNWENIVGQYQNIYEEIRR